jgi:hypothetical protein
MLMRWGKPPETCSVDEINQINAKKFRLMIACDVKRRMKRT